MKHFIITCVLLLATQAVVAQEYRVQGEIVIGTSLFPTDTVQAGVDFNEYGLPEGGYPIDFRAWLSIDQLAGVWQFRFESTDLLQTVMHTVDGPTTSDDGSQIELAISDQGVTIDFNSFGTNAISTDFALQLDFTSQTGSWSWTEDCPPCDLIVALPSAVGTVSTIWIVPEPSSIVLLFCVAFNGLLSRRRATRH